MMRSRRHVHYHKCFLVSATAGTPPGHASSEFRSALCQREPDSAAAAEADRGATTLAATGLNGTYTGIVFNNEARPRAQSTRILG